MAGIVHQCPHCWAEKMTLTIVAQSYGPGHEGRHMANYVHLTCRECSKPSCAEMIEPNAPGAQLTGAESFPFGIQRHGWVVGHIWPEPPKPRLPEHLPDAVARALLAAEKNFVQTGMEEASAGSYGRALDIGTKLYAPDLGALTLFARIKKLAELHRITPELAAWANVIRLIRNDALHEIDSVTRDDLVAIRGFTETVLTYLFTLPGMLRERQALTEQKPKG